MDPEHRYRLAVHICATKTRLSNAKQQGKEQARWSSRHAFVSEAGNLWLKSRTDQIVHSVVNGLPSLRHFEKTFIARKRNDAKMGPANPLHSLT